MVALPKMPKTPSAENLDQAKTAAAAAVAFIAFVSDESWQDRLKPLARVAPSGKLRNKIAETIALASSMADTAATDADVERARGWRDRATALQVRLALPVTTSKAEHRREVAADLARLHRDINTALGATPSGDEK